MHTIDAESYLALLACVARADGVIAPEEVQFLRVAMHGASLEADAVERLERLLDVSVPAAVDDVVGRAVAGTNPVLLLELLRDAYVVAWADHEVAAAEIAVVDAVLARVGIAVERRPGIHEWARRAGQAHLDGISLLAEAWPEQDADSNR